MFANTPRKLQPSSLACRFAVIICCTFLSACALSPGAYLGADAKGERIEDLIDIRPITRQLINESAAQPSTSLFTQSQPESLQPFSSYDYLIGRGDVLSIIVYDHPELTIPAGSERTAAESGNVVHSDGTIFYPYIGQIEVASRTVRDVRDDIQNRLAAYLAKPQVDVKVVAFNAQKAYVTGQVTHPGKFAITNVPMRVLDALSLAGGLTEAANWHNVVLTRNGREKVLSVYDMLTNGNLQQNELLRDGDLLHVPEAGNQQVYVMGEVSRPQAFALGGSHISLTNAIARAGGLHQMSADASGIFVIRRNNPASNKFATVYQLDAKNAAAFVLGTEFMLRPTDIVYVTAAPVSRWNRVISQLVPSLTSIYQLTEIGNNLDGGSRD